MTTLLAAASALALSFGAVAAAPESAPDASAYAQMPTFRSVSISPSGNRVSALYRAEGDEEYSFAVFDRSDGGFQIVYAVRQDEKFRIANPIWIRDDRIVFTVRFGARRYATDTVETRLMSLDPDTGEIIPLFEAPRRGATGSRLGSSGVATQIQDDIVSLTRHDPTSILVAYWNEGLYGVNEVQVDHIRRHKRSERGRSDVQAWYADERGELRAARGLKNEKEPVLRMVGSDGEWIDRSVRVAEGAPTFRVLGFPNFPGKAFVASNHETATDALYLYDADADAFERQLFSNPVSDVYDVVQQRGTGAALGVTFAEEDGDIHWFGENFVRDVIEQMKLTFPDRSVTLTDLNAEQTHATILIDGANEPGAFHLFDIEGNEVTALPPQYPALEGVPKGAVIATSYEARDGLAIPAFVTLPPWVGSLEEAKGLPFVLNPHGGPSARNFLGFDWETQFLASRGYGVLQMNFRGSDGYGEAFRAAGDRQWGQAMQDDVTDGARWLVDQGYADEGKLAILGGSYGGYAALMGAVKTPDLYQCAVAFAPVTDLPALIRDERRYINGAYATRHPRPQRGRDRGAGAARPRRGGPGRRRRPVTEDARRDAARRDRASLRRARGRQPLPRRRRQQAELPARGRGVPGGLSGLGPTAGRGQARSPRLSST